MNHASHNLTLCDVCSIKLNTITWLIQLLTFLVAFGIGIMAFRFSSIRREIGELKTKIEQLDNRLTNGETRND